MGLITKEVQVRVNSKTAKYYENLGYVLPKRLNKKGKIIYNTDEFITVSVNDLPKGSGVNIECICDYCGKTMNMKYNQYFKIMNQTVPKISCKECKWQKTAESNLIVYGVKSTLELEETQEKIENSLLQHYGVTSPFLSQEIQERRRSTLINKYGVDNPSQVSEFQEKKKSTCLKTTGYEYAIQSPIIQEQMKKKMLETYGVEYATQSAEIYNKIRNTNRQKYNSDNPMQNAKVKEKALLTNEAKYGFRYISQVPEFRAKAVKTLNQNQSVATSIQQRYISNLYNTQLNYPILYWNVDMYDKKNDIIFEYDGGGHFLQVKLGDMTMEEFEQKERVREIMIRREGYKMIRIISLTDKLPTDEILLQMLADAKQYFKDFPEHSWINFDIDNGIVRNAKHKEGVLYTFGQLRKIKQPA